MKKIIALLVMGSYLSGCASVPYNCNESCARSGQICLGESHGKSSNWYVGESQSVSFNCGKPTTDEDMKNIEHNLVTGKEKEKETEYNNAGIAVLSIIAGAVAGFVTYLIAK